VELAKALGVGDWGVTIGCSRRGPWAAGRRWRTARSCFGPTAVRRKSSCESGAERRLRPATSIVWKKAGVGVARDERASVVALTTAAQEGRADAQWMLGELMLTLAAKPSHVREAMQWLEKAAAQGHCRAMLQLAQKSDLPGALAWYEKAASLGSAQGMWRLAGCCRDGLGTAKDMRNAAFWTLKAADQGLAEAVEVAGDVARKFPEQRVAVNAQLRQDRISALHWFRDRGFGVTGLEVLEWIKTAAAYGVAYGQCVMGTTLLHGSTVNEVPKDEKQAAAWLAKSAKQGDARAQYELAWCHIRATGVAQNFGKAEELFLQAPTQGHAASQLEVGLRCFEERRAAGARVWLTRTAEQGLAEAQCVLGHCMLLGQCMPKDQAAAVLWFRESSEQRLATGMFCLGLCLKRGRGVARDDRAAVDWFEKAAAAGDVCAHFYLGICHFKGQGVEKNATRGFTSISNASVHLSFADRCMAVCLVSGLGCGKDYKWAMAAYLRSEQRFDRRDSSGDLLELRRLARDPMRVVDECEVWAWVRPPKLLGASSR
jgi:TPR repeat protein